MPRNENLNPRRTTTRGGSVSSKHVQRYARDPGGRVMAQRDHNGNVHVFDGAHRRQAAINENRSLPAKVWGPDEKLPEYVGGGCAAVTFALLAGLGGIGWTAVELASRVVGA